MADDSSTQVQQQPPAPNPALKKLDRLAGTWRVFGPEIKGQVKFEWMEGGHFIVQSFDLNHAGHKAKGIEIIGYGRDWDGTTSEECKSHLFDNDGNTFSYVWDLDGDSLTIWGGERGSPAYFKGTFSSDGNTLAGAWVWPGGGYESTMTRMESQGA
jgi:hypothetical protein